MRPLLWKEMRDLRVWVAAGALLVGSFELLCRTASFRNTYESVYLALLLPVLLTVAAVGLGAGQIARERHTRSLGYLLVRPVSPTLIVWTKFLAGTVALALLCAALIGLGYLEPQKSADTAVRAIREQTGFQAAALTLFPRYWCVYGLTLLFSVLLDRAAKVAAIMAAIAVTTVALAMSFELLAPFSHFVSWLPFIDSSGGLISAAKSASISAGTGLVFAIATTLLAGLAAILLKRSPERYLGNPGLIALAAGIVAAAALSAHGASVRFAAMQPTGSFDFRTETDENGASLVADGDLAVILLENQLRFVDFSNPSKPKLVGDISMPLWSPDSDWSAGGHKAAIRDGTVFLIGKTKAVPVEQQELILVKPGVSIEEIPLGAAVPHDFISRPVPVGSLIYLAITHDRQCAIHVIDPASHQEVAALPLEKLRPAVRGVDEGQPPITLCRRGDYLYVASPSALTALDVREPSRPLIASRLQSRPKVSFLYGFPRQLAWQDDHLFEITFWPYGLQSYDLANPPHPVATSELVWHDGFRIASSGKAMYMPWQQGVLEFRAEGNDLRGQRYLWAGDKVTALALGSHYLFALTNGNDKNQRVLQAFH